MCLRTVFFFFFESHPNAIILQEISTYRSSFSIWAHQSLLFCLLFYLPFFKYAESECVCLSVRPSVRPSQKCTWEGSLLHARTHRAQKPGIFQIYERAFELRSGKWFIKALGIGFLVRRERKKDSSETGEWEDAVECNVIDSRVIGRAEF